MSGATTPTAEVKRRLAIARKTVEAGGNLSRFAEAIGMTPSGALMFLRRYAPELGPELVDPARDRRAHGALVRLLLIRVAMEFRGGRRKLAPGLGMSDQGLCQFTKWWAPDGVDSAIADLWPDDSPPEFLPAKPGYKRKSISRSRSVGSN